MQILGAPVPPLPNPVEIENIEKAFREYYCIQDEHGAWILNPVLHLDNFGKWLAKELTNKQ